MYIVAIAFAEKNYSPCVSYGKMSSRQNRQPRRPMSSGGYPQQHPLPPAYNHPPTGAQTPGGEPPQTLRLLNLIRKGRIDDPLGGTMNAHNTTPRYLHPAHDNFPRPRPKPNNTPRYQPHHAQPQPSNTNSNSYTPSMDWNNSDQTVHASHQPATYADNNHTRGTSRAQGKFLLASSDNLEDVSLNGAMKPRG